MLTVFFITGAISAQDGMIASKFIISNYAIKLYIVILYEIIKNHRNCQSESRNKKFVLIR